MGFINNITGGGASGGAASNSVSSKIVDELKVDVAVVETKVNSLPFDITGVKVDKNFDLNNFVVTNVPTPTASNHIANKGYVESWIKKDGSGNIDAEKKKITNLAMTPSADRDAVSFGFLNLYLPRTVYGDISSNYHMQTKRICSLGKPTAYADATTKNYVDLSIRNATKISAFGGIKKDATNQYELNVPQAQRLVAPVLLNGSIIKDASGSMSVDVALNGGINKDVTGRLQLNVPEAKTLIAPVLANGGIERDGTGKLKINVATAQKLIAPVLPLGGVERDSSGKIKLVDAVVKSLIMMDGNYHSWSNEFIKNNASGHWLISDNSLLSSKVAKYGVLSGTNVESLQYQGFGERKNIVKYSDAERPTSGTGLINGRYNYVSFDGANDRMKCDMDLNITSGDKTLSITVVYRLTSYGAGVGCVNGIIGNDNPGWDHFICMNDSKHFIVSNAKKESTSFNGGDNITITTFPTKANPTELNKWIVLTVTWSPQLGADGSQVWCNGQKLRNFTAKENVGATHFVIGSIAANSVAAPLAGDIAELIVFKREDELNNASTIKRIQKHLLDKYAIKHEPMLSM